MNEPHTSQLRAEISIEIEELKSLMLNRHEWNFFVYGFPKGFVQQLLLVVNSALRDIFY